jgi:hypothetical protein
VDKQRLFFEGKHQDEGFILIGNNFNTVVFVVSLIFRVFQSRCSGTESSIGIQAVNDVGLFGLSSLLRRRLINSGLVDKALIDYSRFSTFFDMEKNKQESMGNVLGLVSFQ